MAGDNGNQPKVTKIRETDDILIQAISFNNSSLLQKRHGQSKQVDPRATQVTRLDDTAFDDVKVIRPPFDFDGLAEITTFNSRLAKSINVMAKNVVGLGWDIVDTLEEDERRDLSEAENKKLKVKKRRLKQFIKNSNPDIPFDIMMTLIKTDEETLGNAFLEVVRNNKFEIFEFHHIPGKTIRIRKNKEGFVQIRGTKKKYFVPFGRKERVDPETGEPSDAKLIQDIATEIIHYKLDHPSNDFYGLPRWITASPCIVGARLADERNINFMQNDATPRIIITVSGGDLDNESMESIEKFINLEGKGVENASRVMLLQINRKGSGALGNQQSKIEVTPLTVGLTDDASFLKYRAANNDEIKELFGISDLFYGMSRDINRAAAAVAKQVTNEQEFEPERKRFEHSLNHKLFTSENLGFDVDGLELKFKSPVINDLAGLADAFSKAGAAGGLTPNNIKKLAGMEPYPQEPNFAWADFPMPIAQALIAAGLIRFNPIGGTESAGESEDDNESEHEGDDVTDEIEEE